MVRELCRIQQGLRNEMERFYLLRSYKQAKETLDDIHKRYTEEIQVHLDKPKQKKAMRNPEKLRYFQKIAHGQIEAPKIRLY